MSRLFFFLAFTLFSIISTATPLTRDKTPEPLKPWVNWVLQGEDNYQCPFFYNNFNQKHCSWPASLALDLYPKKAKFISRWHVYKESWIVLPGDHNYWPQNVTVNNEPALVIQQQSKPKIKLAPGSYQIKGDFYWDQIPENLAIPINTGLFSLKINTKAIPHPIIKKNSVWLKESDIGQKKSISVENKVDLQVYRKIDDTVPLQLTTILDLEISGDQRELSFSHALLKDFIAISLKSSLAARIEPDGSLLIQARPGRWQIELKARYPKPVSQLTLNVADKLWPQSEIWSFNAQPSLRLIEIAGLKAIDPSQTNVPRAWKQLPAYLLTSGDTMTFKVIRRGDPEPEPNQLGLSRQLWLDFNGEAYTVSDTINGKMTKDWRINALAETKVGQIKLNGQNQLVTTSTKTGKQGVEVRKGNISLQADSRISGSISNISAVGWEQNFHQVKAELNIPPGWRLLAASGVDNDPSSWISQWTLLDLFLVLIASLAVSQLWNMGWGIFALVTLSLCWHEAGAPHFIWLNILAATALIRVLPDGIFQKMITWYRVICWLTLLVIAIPFMVSQVRTGLYPQLENQWQQITPAVYEMATMESDESVDMRKSVSKMRAVSPSASMRPAKKMLKPKLVERIDPDANIQTGPGLPQWQWKKIHLSWNGSVDQQQQIKFWYLTPMVTMLLNFLRVLLVLILGFLMLDISVKKFNFTLPHLSWMLLLPLLSLPVQDVSADFPEQKLLDELRTRLLKTPDCLPGCAEIPTMSVAINPQNLNIKLQAHLQQAVAIPLPAKLEQWFPNQVSVNGQAAKALFKTDKGQLWISLDKGIHTIELLGLNPAQNKFSIPLTLKPQQTKISASGWNVTGVHQNGRTDNQLIISRTKTLQQLQAQQEKFEAGALPAFIRIERTLNLGLDWRITTRVIRVFNNDTAVSLSIPVLENESVTSAKTRVKDKHVLVNLSPQQHQQQWQSVLKKTPQINLKAAQTQQWTEVWRANISPIWHLETSGLAVIHHQKQGKWLPEWRPWPGEEISLNITRPKAVKGSTVTIDKTDLLIKPGKRSIETDFNLIIRSSKGTQHTITLPEQVILQSVNINGLTQPIRQKKSQVTLPLKPGKQSITLKWQKMQEQSSFLTTAQINLGINSVNNHLNILLGRDRWILFTSGPKFGPAVLFWGVLIVIILLAIGLGKIPITPLKHWHWFLLLIGLSQIPIMSALIVVIWLMALGYRSKKQIVDPGYFNAAQIGLGLLTLVAVLLLFVAVEQGLLGSPDMQIAGNQSSSFNLKWYQDRSIDILPTATVISVPLMTYRILMLLWSLWLAISLLNWLKWGWNCFSTEGLWKARKTKEQTPPLSNDHNSKDEFK